jgi:hypothetical protein
VALDRGRREGTLGEVQVFEHEDDGRTCMRSVEQVSLLGRNVVLCLFTVATKANDPARSSLCAEYEGSELTHYSSSNPSSIPHTDSNRFPTVFALFFPRAELSLPVTGPTQ